MNEANRRPVQWLRELFREFLAISRSLLAIIVPVLLLLRILEALGAVRHIGDALEPAMRLVGLPAETGFALASTMVTNIYGGLIVLASLPDLTLTHAQASTLGGMMLLCHGLILEGAIAKRIGLSFSLHLALRCGCAMVFGLICHGLFTALDIGTDPSSLQLPHAPDDIASFDAWLYFQAKNLLFIEAVIFVLLLLKRALEASGLDRALTWLLKPLLSLFGVSQRLSSVFAVGITMGLAYGGGILLQETRREGLHPRDIRISLCFVALFHGVIEDTLAVMLIGGDLLAFVLLRLVIAVAATFILARAWRVPVCAPPRPG